MRIRPFSAILPVVMAIQPDEITVEANGHDVILTLRGEFDMTRVTEFDEAVAAVLTATPATLTLDVTGLTFIDSRGIGALVGAWRQARAAAVTLVVEGPPAPNVRRVLELTGVDDLFRS
jgi:anti-sigma B factor antagonist